MVPVGGAGCVVSELNFEALAAVVTFVSNSVRRAGIAVVSPSGRISFDAWVCNKICAGGSLRLGGCQGHESHQHGCCG